MLQVSIASKVKGNHNGDYFSIVEFKFCLLSLKFFAEFVCQIVNFS
jgi:hypothetical protein